MTGPSSSPRGEHAGTPGTTWQTALVTTGEIVVDTDRDENPFGWSELDTTVPDMNQPYTRPNRATRRAAARAARRTK